MGRAATRREPGPARRRRSAGIRAFCAGALTTSAAAAHDGGHGVPTLATAVTLSPLLLVPLAVFAALYATGLRRLWRGGHAGRGVSVAESVGFACGMIALLLATVWPFDALGEWSLAAHMAQHMLLLAVAPPLLLSARPRAALAAALPPDWSRALHRATQACAIAPLRSLAAATLANAAVMWGWHSPAALELALASEAVHWLMHASFLLAGLWLWTLLWQRLRDDAAGGALAGTVAIVVVMMQMGFLGALLTFSRRGLYPFYLDRAPQLGLDALADQQLAGLIMWVPSCLPYLAGAVWLLAREFGRLRRAGPG
jgi:putative membrane protein